MTPKRTSTGTPRVQQQRQPTDLKSEFPLLADGRLCYLDSAATTQKPQCVLDTLNTFYRRGNANVHRATYDLAQEATLAFEQARSRVARFLGASPEEIVWTRGATESINLVAQSWGESCRRGERILVSQMEHHANILPWQQLAQRRGLSLEPIPLTAAGDIDLDAYRELLDDSVRLVAVTQVSNVLGTCNPVRDMARLAHEAGALVLVDGAQAVAHLPVDVRTLECDFYVFSGHKVYGPTGIGVLYGRQELLETLPPWQTGGEMVTAVSFSESRFLPPPLRFEAGTPPIAEALGLAAALNWLDSLDRKALDHQEARLLEEAERALRGLPGVQVLGTPRMRRGNLSFTLAQAHALDLGAALNQEGIALRTGHHCCMPLMRSLGIEGTSRLSLGCYNQAADLAYFLRTLERLLSTRPLMQPPHTSVIADLQKASSRRQRQNLLMSAGQAPLSQDESLHRDCHLVHGCASRVWLRCRLIPETGRLNLELDSDARIIRGLCRLLLERLQQSSPSDLLAFDAQSFLKELGLAEHLNPSRTSGLRAIVAALKKAARKPRSGP